MYQLAVLCRDMLAERSAWKRNLVQDPSWYLFNIWCFEVYKVQANLFLLYHYWKSVNRPPTLAPSGELKSMEMNIANEISTLMTLCLCCDYLICFHI